jgi:hypothetical protein
MKVILFSAQFVIPGRTRPCAGEPGIHSHGQASGFRVHAKMRVPE